MHCQDKNHEGFISADIFSSLTKNELQYAYCFRCQLLNNNKKLLNSKKFDYDELILKDICEQKKTHVILLIDLCDIPNSIYVGWRKLITCKNDIDVMILGMKIENLFFYLKISKFFDY